MLDMTEILWPKVVVSYYQRQARLVLVNCLEGLSMPRNGVIGVTDRLNMTLAVDWAVKPHTNKQTNFYQLTY